MSFLLFRSPNGHYSSIWEIIDNKAIRIGMPNPENIDGFHCTARPGQSTIDAILEVISTHKQVWHQWPLELDPGQYYPRMARPPYLNLERFPAASPGTKEDANIIAISLGQLSVLTRQLAEICQTAHPSESTLDIYGHTIRNLLILACTEVESHWRGVLVANGIKKEKFTTSHYVEILAPLQLDKYSLRYPYFPWLNTRRPFHGWDADAPTKSLSWYDAYNSVKHDREKNFTRATLGHAFDAVSACAVMMLAQYGYGIIGWDESEPARFFSIDERPAWSPSDVYIIDDTDSDAITPIPYPFARLR